MPTPDEIRELADKIVEVVRTRTGAFLDDHVDAKDFLLERAKRLAALMLALARADANDIDAIKADIAVVQQSVENEVASVAVDAAVEARDTFRAVLNTVFEVAQKMLPTLLALL